MRKIKPSSSILWLAVFIILLALIATCTGLFLPGGTGPISFTTLQGQTVEIFGRGLYHRDTVFVGAGSQGADAVTLGIGIPLLAICGLLHWRGSLRGTLLLLGSFVYFLYIYASYALGGVVYNRLLLVYIALFSASLYAVVLTFRLIERQHLAALTSSRLPRLGPAIFMIASGCVTLFIWLTPLLPALVQDQPPATLGSYYTGRVTDALDLGLITPTTFLAGWLILRRSPLGYLIALALLVLEIMLLPMITAQTISQLAAGIAFTSVEIIGPITGFAILGLLAIWVTVALLKPLASSTS
ncbi:hypothetical protein C7271_01445 [filamentous cyanobacterium CCP5]|nr:hypothetical protein C7271_01445 [filamentous cyanobacterium CCP5]